MIGDGNCYYRAVCVGVYGKQDAYASLRKSLADYVILQQKDVSAVSSESLKRLAADIQMDGSWAGEDVILATANYLRRPLHVYCASRATSPLIYSPDEPFPFPVSPILLAFFEPGHFRAVVRNDDVINTSTHSGN